MSYHDSNAKADYSSRQTKMKKYKITAYDIGCLEYREGKWIDKGQIVMYANSLTLRLKLLKVIFFDYIQVERIDEQDE